MAKKISKICQVCENTFSARRDAKTCSPTCRKRYERSLKARAIERAKRLEEAAAQELGHLAASFMPRQLAYAPVEASNEPDTNFDQTEEATASHAIPVSEESSGEQRVIPLVSPVSASVPEPGMVVTPTAGTDSEEQQGAATTGEDNQQGDQETGGPADWTWRLLGWGALAVLLLLATGLLISLNWGGDNRTHLGQLSNLQQRQANQEQKQIISVSNRTTNLDLRVSALETKVNALHVGNTTYSTTVNNLGGGTAAAAGLPSDVALRDADNAFSGSNTFAKLLGANGGVATNGADINTSGGSITTGSVALTNLSGGREVILQGLNPSGSGNAIVQVPVIAGGSTDTVCLLTLGNCVGAGGSVSTSGGTQNYITKYNNAGANQLTSSELFDNGTGVSIGNASPAGLFNVGTTNQFQVSNSGAVTAVGLNGGSGLIQGSGGLSVGGASNFTGTLAIQGANALTIGTASANTGAIVLQGSGGAGTLTLQGPTTPNAGNFTLSIPAITGNANLCTDNSVCAGYAAVSGSGNYIQNGTSPQTANFNITGSGTINTNLTVNGIASVNSYLKVASGLASTTQTDLTESLTHSSFTLIDDYVTNAYVPGFFWSTADNNPTAPKAGIYLQETNTGTYMLFGTSNNYAAGVTNNAIVINPSGGSIFQNGVDSATAFQVQNAGMTSVLNVDSTNSIVTVRGANSDATMGAELITDGTFAGGTWTTTGWTVASSQATHTSGNTNALSTTQIAVAANTTYDIYACYSSNTTAGATVTTSIGGVSGLALVTPNGFFCGPVIITTGSSPTNVLSFTPSSTWNGVVGSIDVHVLTTSNSALTVQNSSGASAVEVRSNDNPQTTLIGLAAGQYLNSGSTAITAIGAGALQNASTGEGIGPVSSDTAIGANALQNDNTPGFNTAVGAGALQSLTISNSINPGDTAVGYNSLHNSTTGSGETALGYQTLLNTTSGVGNVAIGYNAGTTNTTGANNTFLGNNTNVSSGNLSNSTAIGIDSQVNASNSLVLGCVDGTNSCTANTKVGIDKTIPAYTLDVAGDIHAAGSLVVSGGAQISGLAQPSAPTITQGGTAGSTHYSYAIAALNAAGGSTAVSTVTQTTTGNATLTGTNLNKVTWTPVAGVVQYQIFRTASSGTPSTTGLIGTVNGNEAAVAQTFNDTGIAAGEAAPSTDTSGLLNVINSVVSTLATPCVSAVASSSGGSLATNTYKYEITALDGSGGESSPTCELTASVTGPTGSVTVSWISAFNPSNTTYRVYRGTSSGLENTYYTTSSTPFVDTGAAGTSASPPADSSAYSLKLNSSGTSWLNGGNVGIGNAAPSFLLDVAGTINTSTQYDVGGVQIASSNLSDSSNIAKLSANNVFTGSDMFKDASPSASAFVVQNTSGFAVLSADTSANQVTLGQASQLNGQLTFADASNGNTVTLVSGATTSSYSLTLPTTAGSAGQCLELGGSSTQLQFASCGSSSAGLARNATDTSSANVASGFLYQFTNSSSATASSVLQLDNGTNTNSTLKVTAAGNPTSGQALIFAYDTNASPTGNLLDLQAGSGPTSVFSVSATGAATAQGGATVQGGTVNINAGSNNATNINTGGSTGAVAIGNGSSSSVNILGGTTGITLSGAGGTTNVATLVKPASDTSAAFVIQNAAATATLLNADTTSLILTVAGTTSIFANLTLNNAHFKSAQTTAPTVTTQPTTGNCGAASAPNPIAVITAGSTDSAGSFYINSGTTAAASCNTTITFNQAYGAAPKAIILSQDETLGGTLPATSSTVGIGRVTAVTSTTFTVTLNNSDVANTRYGFYYWVIE